MDGSDRSLRPALPACCIQRIAHDCLHQPVHQKRLYRRGHARQANTPAMLLWLARAGRHQWSLAQALLPGAPLPAQDLLGDSIRREVGAQPQEVSGCRIRLLHACKGE